MLLTNVDDLQHESVPTEMFVPVFMKPLFSAQLENLQKRIYQLEEQLHSEMQLKDELEQKCR